MSKPRTKSYVGYAAIKKKINPDKKYIDIPCATLEKFTGTAMQVREDVWVVCSSQREVKSILRSSPIKSLYKVVKIKVSVVK